MKALGLVSLLMTLGVIGFLLVKQTREVRQGPSVVQAKAMEDQARVAMAVAAQVTLRTAVAEFRQAKGRPPASLDELKAAGLIETVPGGVAYDPSTGDVTVQGGAPGP